ncbi:MAG: hypothetical protein V9H69_05380 [Anaerolineae bacterium]
MGDVARANVLVLEDPRADYQAFNVGGGAATSVLEYGDADSSGAGGGSGGGCAGRISLRRHPPHRLGHQQAAPAWAGRQRRRCRRSSPNTPPGRSSSPAWTTPTPRLSR